MEICPTNKNQETNSRKFRNISYLIKQLIIFLNVENSTYDTY